MKGAKKLGVRLGNWLTADEARRFWQSPTPDTLKGTRDRAILAVLLGCGLRRRELADLDFAHLQQREEHWAIVDLVGKGGHIRTVPVPEWVKAHDLRRSCAKLCHRSGGELEQIQFLLGHVSVQTTERYLGCKQRIHGAVNDCIGIEP